MTHPTRTRRMMAVAAATAMLAVLAVPVTGQSDQAQSQAHVENLRPQVTSVTVTTDDAPDQPGAQVDPTAGSTRTFQAEFTAEDRNNHKDIHSGSCDLIGPDGDLRDTLKATGGQGNGKQGTWSVSGRLAYHDQPGQWTLRCSATDREMNKEGQAPNEEDMAETTFEVRELAAVGWKSSVVRFTQGGAMQPGATTSPTSVSVENMGNVAVDLLASATALAGPESASIAPDRIAVATDQAMSDGQGLGGTSTVPLGLAPGEGSTAEVWFTLDVPAGDEQYIPAGAYTGQLSLSAVPS